MIGIEQGHYNDQRKQQLDLFNHHTAKDVMSNFHYHSFQYKLDFTHLLPYHKMRTALGLLADLVDRFLFQPCDGQPNAYSDGGGAACIASNVLNFNYFQLLPKATG